MKQGKSSQSMTKNSMLWFKLGVISVIISFQMSLFYILNMKLSSMPTLKSSLTIIMGNESPSYRNTPLLFDINLVLRTRQLTLVVEWCLFFLLWLYMSWGFDLLKWNYNSCNNFSIIHDAFVAGNVGAYLDFSLHDMETFSKGPTFAYLTHHFESEWYGDCIIKEQLVILEEIRQLQW